MHSEHKIDVIVTVNPNDMSADVLRRLVQRGATIFRLNGSFLLATGAEAMVKKIRESCGDSIDILLDLPGFKPRFTYLEEKLYYKEGEPFVVPLKSINYPEIVSHMKVGDCLRINDGMVRLSIDSIDDEKVVVIPDYPGVLRRGKGFYLENTGFRPHSHCLSENDYRLIQMARDCGINYVGISFVHNRQDIEKVKDALAGSSTGYIPKIEARESYDLENLVSILKECDRVIIDRGDTAGELGLESVWFQQRRVLHLAKLHDCKVIMATQFFNHMLNNPLPSIAEVDSFYDLVKSGISGVQFSEETCVGKFGEEVISFVCRNFNIQIKAMKKIASPKITWIMGPSAAGKTSIARELVLRIKGAGVPAVHYDGDEIRALFGENFGFEAGDRLLVVSAIINQAKKMMENGNHVVVSALTANQDARELLFNSFNAEELYTILLECPVDECKNRDPKGLYKLANEEKISTMIGCKNDYLPCSQADFVLSTVENDLSSCCSIIIEKLLFECKLIVPFHQ